MTPSQTLRALLWPVYVPSFGYAAGIAALLPAYVLLALKLGFSAAQIALIATLVGAFAIVASLAAGYLVHWLGERLSLGLTSGLTITLLGATWAAAGSDPDTARVILVVALLGVDLSDAVWSIARQGLVADLAPPEHRGRAMNAYGASQRLGRVVGPFVAAAVLVVASPQHVLPVTALLVGAAYVLMAYHLRRPQALEARAAALAAPTAGVARPIRALVILGVGVLALTAVRTAKETLVPLWGADGLGLSDPTVAVVAGAGSLAELALFWPAGMALDRVGRGPVAAVCLALIGGGLMLMPLSGATWWFVATALVVGLGDGVGAGIVKIIGIDIAPPERRGQFLGWWQSIASVGALAAPALASLVIALASLAAVLPVIGGLGLAGAAWMAHWTPRVIPPPSRGGRREGGADAVRTAPHLNA